MKLAKSTGAAMSFAPRQAVIVSPDQLIAIESWIKELDPFDAGIATKMFEDGSVLDVHWSRKGFWVTGMVKDGRKHRVSIVFEIDDEIEECVCSCSNGSHCAHSGAVMMKLRADVRKTEAGLPKHPALPPVHLSAPSAPVSRLEPQLHGLAVEVRERAGRPLTQNAIRALAGIDLWWARKTRVVTEGDFRSMTCAPDLWARNNTSLFPKSHPPESAWELLHYIDHVATRLQLSLPNPIPDALDRALQKKLVGVWERERTIREWTARLETWAGNAQRTSKVTEQVPEFRLRLTGDCAVVEWRQPHVETFLPIKVTPLREWCGVLAPYGQNQSAALLRPHDVVVLQAAGGSYGHARIEIPAGDSGLIKCLTRLLFSPDMRAAVVTESGQPLPHHDTPLRWELREAPDEKGEHELHLLDADGNPPPPSLAIVRGRSKLYVTPQGTWEINAWPFESDAMSWPQIVPASVLESSYGATVLEHLGIALPQRLAKRVIVVKPRVSIHCRVKYVAPYDYLRVLTNADFAGHAPEEKWNGGTWQPTSVRTFNTARGDEILRIDRSLIRAAGDWLSQLGLKMGLPDNEWEKRVGKDFPDEFLAWLERQPEGIEIMLSGELASLRDGKISATVKLDVEEAGIDWFDLKVALDVSDTTLTREDIDLLLKANGKWVRITGKGWRRLEYQLSEEQERELAEMGLAVSDFDGQTQRLHALQLAGNASKKHSMLPAGRVEEVRLRASEIQTRVAPDVPAAITATMRPYQREGFHFLAYLTANHFGGILADDMGLGKTLQTLAWLAWLRGDAESRKDPVLVICPKSVQDNWRNETARFYPTLKVEMWNRNRAGQPLPDDCDMLVIHYQQLRNHEDQLTRQHWSAVILDEAQAIKNPSSQTAIAAGKLRADHRLALTGTPIENRLLDLWSIMNFAMPGVLSNRAQFTKNFDAKGDPFARRRLAARTRPFLLRRTKKEVASDLPDRIEEDLVCELEGTQEKLYNAELKRARAALLKLKTSKELDKARFNVLTSLLRLRQICCHPKLVGTDAKDASSAKLDALIELLEPLMQEGHKVIVFSQFVDMIHLIEDELVKNEWPHFILTGATDERGALVDSFQNKEGAAVFLISLKAGGFGLNLTAASYVVLYDPWWNPAVEAQAIDRTHRIGQTRTVIAYRLIMQETIEEKIRQLQKHKSAIAQDILGEENFAKALTLDDFRFLLGEE